MPALPEAPPPEALPPQALPPEAPPPGAPADPLFAPVRIGTQHLPNRVVMGPLGRGLAGPDGVPPADAAVHYARRASAGLIIAEGCHVSPAGRGRLGETGLYSPDQVAGWRAVTRAVHAAGGRIWVQLMHCGRAGHRSVTGGRPVAPSAVRAPGELRTPGGRRPFDVPEALTAAGIEDVVGEFARACRLATDAGFDGVELHGGNGYLVHQFLARGSNRRTDRFGTDRALFTQTLAEAAAAAIGAGRVGLRLSPGSPVHGPGDDDAARTCAALVERLAPLGLGYLHLTGLDAADPLVARLRWGWPGPLVVAPGSGTGPTPPDGGRSAARAWLGRGADLIAFGRAFLTDPDLVHRLRTGAPGAPPGPEGPGGTPAPLPTAAR